MKKLLLLLCSTLLFAVFSANGKDIEDLDAVNSEPRIQKTETTIVRDFESIKRTDVESRHNIRKSPSENQNIDVQGLYQWKYYNSFENPEYGGWQTTNIQVVATDEEGVVDFYGYLDFKFSGTLDTVNQTITFEKQLGFENSSAGFVFWTPCRWNDNGSGFQEVESIIATYDENGIYFDDYDIWCLTADLNTFYGPILAYSMNMYVIPTFKYDKSEWKDIANVEYKDGWLKGRYSYTISIQENLKNPNLLCIMNPYGNETPYASENSIHTNGYIVIDINDPDCVLVNQMVFSGFKYSYDECYYMFNSECAYYNSGMSLEQIKKNYQLAKKEISRLYKKTDDSQNYTIRIPNCLFGKTEDPTQQYYWVDAITGERREMIAEIEMPTDWKPSVNVTKISLNKTYVPLNTGETYTLTATITPENATNQIVTWSTTDAAVANVKDGVITAVGGGECDIIATAHNGVNAKCHVKVKQEASGISFNTTSISMNSGEQVQIEVIFEPDNTTERTLTWTSSDTSVATVTNGLVKAIGGGEASITATTENGLSAVCNVTVLQEVTKVNISETRLRLAMGETAQLEATVSPENASDQSIVWSSEDPSVATVSETGFVTAVGVGETNIVATASNGKYAKCNTRVKAIDPESISLDMTALTIDAGDSQTLHATITPADATNQDLTWTTSDPGVATVEDGVVTGVAGGACTVKATTVNGLEAVCEVTVREKATGIELSETELNLEVGETHQLTVTFYPETTTERHITWVTSDASVATVEDGLVTVVGVGTARIKATYALGISATCVVNATADVDVLLADGATCDVYTVTGILVRRDATRHDIERLTPDVYILRRGATVVKLHLP